MSSRIHSYTRDSLQFDVIDSGPLDGPVGVLLHGFPQRATCWEQVSQVLNQAGMRTLAPDQRGYSPGARPWGRAAYRISELVADVVELIERVGAPVHLVGHDWGATVGWALAQRHPDLLATYTAVSVPHPRAMIKAAKHGQATASWYMGFFQLPLIPELILSTPALNSRILGRTGMGKAELQRFQREMVEQKALRGGLGWYRGLPFGAKKTGAFSEELITVPTTMVWSDGDPFLVRHGAEHTGDYVAGAYELVVLEGVSHWIPDEAPQELAAAILARSEI